VWTELEKDARLKCSRSLTLNETALFSTIIPVEDAGLEPEFSWLDSPQNSRDSRPLGVLQA